MDASAHPLYERVKSHILHQISSGVWTPGEKIPSESELITQLNVSKMTANRALRELAHSGHLRRVVGVGTFVTEPKIESDLLEIPNIAEEIRARGHVYSARVELLAEERANSRLAENLGLTPGAKVFHSIVIHADGDIPIQLEDRYINPALAPNYLSADFSQKTPGEYLTELAPAQEAEHIVEALMPPKPVAKLLAMPEGEPCLVVSRRTWAKGIVASGSRLYHPSSKYRLGGRFAPIAQSSHGGIS